MFLLLFVAFFSLIALMVIHEFGHFIIAKHFGVRVEEFGIGYPPRLFGKKMGDTLYSVNLIPLGAFVKIYGEEGDVDDYRSFSKLAMWKRILIVLGGVIAFWVAAMVIFSVLFSIGAAIPISDADVAPGTPVNLTIIAVQPNSPAQLAGVEVGDIILHVKNQTSSMSINKVGDFQSFIASDHGNPIDMTIQRQGKDLDIVVSPRTSASLNQGALGVEIERLATIIKKYPFYEAPFEGIAFTWQVTIKSLEGIYGVFANLFEGQGVPAGAQLAGPIGITIFLANAASYGLGFFLYFIGSISVLVAIFNLFPIPALDGGKIVFLLIEKVMGKPVPVKWEETLTIIFFMLLISLSLFITVRYDIPRLVDFWKASV